MQQQLQNQVGKLELKFSKVESAHRLLNAGIQQRKVSSARMRTTIELETNSYFAL